MPPPLPRPSASVSYLQRAQSHNAYHYDYQLPSAKIALNPIPDRSSSRLLVVPRFQSPRHHVFSDLPSLIPPSSLLIRNTSRVIPARIHLEKRQTKGRAQLMLIDPVHQRPPDALASPLQNQVWNAFIGGRRIREGDVLEKELPEKQGKMQVEVLKRDGRGATVKFHGKNLDACGLGEVLELAGEVPLPPYMKKKVTDSDKINYQTVYAGEKGSVAAPTAGLHMTDSVLSELERKGVNVSDVILHVGAGTFQQVEGVVHGHDMHEERVSVTEDVLKRVLKQVKGGRNIVALGTTSVRTLESLYWFGVRLLCQDENKAAVDDFSVGQWEPYEMIDQLGEFNLPTSEEALIAVTRWFSGRGPTIHGQTRLLIVPGYPFKVVNALITNFHQPRSTLLMLVSAFHGGPPQHILSLYATALAQGYRFLSYGDSSIYASPEFFSER